MSELPTMQWVDAGTAEIEDKADYLVLTNGGEWRDRDLFVLRGIQVKHRLAPSIIRGRPLFIAKVVRPALTIKEDK